MHELRSDDRLLLIESLRSQAQVVVTLQGRAPQGVRYGSRTRAREKDLPGSVVYRVESRAAESEGG